MSPGISPAVSPLDATALTPADFQKISRLAHEHFGLSLPSGKEGLVAARLGKAIRDGGYSSFGDYYRHVREDSTGEALIQLIDSLTTNFTSFLREPAHFEFLTQTVTGEFRDLQSLRVWSAACSSGEEPYSIAMTLLDLAAKPACPWTGRFRVLATDISTRVLSKAQQGIYEIERFKGIPDRWRKNFLLRGKGRYEGCYKFKPAVVSAIEFERLNLIQPFPSRSFHFVFCRNVLMYFEKATQQDIVQRLARCVEPGGYLFVGHSETLHSIDHSLNYVCPAVYRRGPAGRRNG
ncbi:MAG TPA: protein-glutamate O-methyltransferase CheR [Bryobacteraceae bacterium]|nr:protein-glutamate O-methyltransferase CheR [Bryobacteraceae bacterium]